MSTLGVCSILQQSNVTDDNCWLLRRISDLGRHRTFSQCVARVTMKRLMTITTIPHPDNAESERWGVGGAALLIDAFTQVVTTVTTQCKWKMTQNLSQHKDDKLMIGFSHWTDWSLLCLGNNDIIQRYIQRLVSDNVQWLDKSKRIFMAISVNQYSLFNQVLLKYLGNEFKEASAHPYQFVEEGAEPNHLSFWRLEWAGIFCGPRRSEIKSVDTFFTDCGMHISDCLCFILSSI